MVKKTKLMRVPDEFDSVVTDISKKYRVTKVKAIEMSIPPLKNAVVLDDLVYSLFRRKKK